MTKLKTKQKVYSLKYKRRIRGRGLSLKRPKQVKYSKIQPKIVPIEDVTKNVISMKNNPTSQKSTIKINNEKPTSKVQPDVNAKKKPKKNKDKNTFKAGNHVFHI